LALVVAAAIFLSGGVASAKTSAVNCGDTVNGFVSLNQNLVCPSTFGLIVGSPNTTIHLNGHSITCSNDALPCFTDEDSGIYSEYNNTQIVGPGKISGFYSQITLESDVNLVQGLTVNGGPSASSADGVFISGTGNVIFHVSDTGGDEVGFCLCSENGPSGTEFGNAVDNSSVDCSNPTGGGCDEHGIVVFGDSQDMLNNNVVNHTWDDGIVLVFAGDINGGGTLVQGNKSNKSFEGDGIESICSLNGVFKNNTANGNGALGGDGHGFEFDHDDCEISEPTVGGVLNPTGFTAPDDHTVGLQVTVTGNVAKQNYNDGFFTEKADASEACFVSDNPCVGSLFSNNNGSGNGDNGFQSIRTYLSQWAHNTFNSNHSSGMWFFEPAADKINGNTTSFNHEDGLTIDENGSCEVTGPLGFCDPQFVNYNTFTFNHEFGAFSNHIVVSALNVAHNNGTSPVDCVNVQCVSHLGAASAAHASLAAGETSDPLDPFTMKAFPAKPGP
jgi:hypothetical protein